MSRKSVLSQCLVDKFGLNPGQADDFVAALFDVIAENLPYDGIVKVKGLGTFKLAETSPRESVDVNTGERITLEGRNKVSFIPENDVRDRINAPFAAFESIDIDDGIDLGQLETTAALTSASVGETKDAEEEATATAPQLLLQKEVETMGQTADEPASSDENPKEVFDTTNPQPQSASLEMAETPVDTGTTVVDDSIAKAEEYFAENEEFAEPEPLTAESDATEADATGEDAAPVEAHHQTEEEGTDDEAADVEPESRPKELGLVEVETAEDEASDAETEYQSDMPDIVGENVVEGEMVLEDEETTSVLNPTVDLCQSNEYEIVDAESPIALPVLPVTETDNGNDPSKDDAPTADVAVLPVENDETNADGSHEEVVGKENLDAATGSQHTSRHGTKGEYESLLHEEITLNKNILKYLRILLALIVILLIGAGAYCIYNVGRHNATVYYVSDISSTDDVVVDSLNEGDSIVAEEIILTDQKNDTLVKTASGIPVTPKAKALLDNAAARNAAARAAYDAKLKAEAERKAKTENNTEAKAKAEAEKKVAEAKAAAEKKAAEAKAKAEAEKKAAEAKAKAEAEKKAAEAKAKAEAEKKAAEAKASTAASANNSTLTAAEAKTAAIYNNKDSRVRTGAYDIVGTMTTVTVRKGETLSSISKFHLGPGMECYVEAYNGGKTSVAEGEQIKIPKVKKKKKSE